MALTVFAGSVALAVFAHPKRGALVCAGDEQRSAGEAVPSPAANSCW